MLTPLPVILKTDAIFFRDDTPLGTGSASPIMLRNYDDKGVLIDKIVVTRIPNDAGAPVPFNRAAGVSVRLRWRNEPITNGYVPILGVAYPRNRWYESGVVGSTTDCGGAVVIHLAKPLYLPPGDFVAIDFQWALTAPGVDILGQAITLQAFAIGRQSAPPAQRWLPYLATFVGPLADGNAAVVYDVQSTADVLGNPFDRPLHVERMIGRVLYSGTDGYNIVVDNGPSPIWGLFNVQISDDRDALWVPTPTPLPAVFDVLDRSWMVASVLAAKGYLTAKIEKDVTTWSAAAYGRFHRPLIGMIGYRQITVEE